MTVVDFWRGWVDRAERGEGELPFHAYVLLNFFTPCAFISYAENKDFKINSGSLFHIELLSSALFRRIWSHPFHLRNVGSILSFRK